MSRAVLYKRSEMLKQRYSLYGMFAAMFLIVTMLVGGVAYASSNLPVYLSLNAAMASGYGPAIFTQSLLTLLSFVAAVAAAFLVFLSRSTTARGEFASSSRLLYAAITAAGLAFIFASADLAPPASQVLSPLYYAYIAMAAAAVALLVYAVFLLRAVTSYYTPRRK